MFPSVKEEATDTFGNSISVKELEDRYNIVRGDYTSITDQLRSDGVEGFQEVELFLDQYILHQK